MLSKYKCVFCDSKKALKWAYKNGLSKNAIIKTSSPALLFENCHNVHHIEKIWSIDNMKKFQSSIENFSEKIYKSLESIDEISHEESLSVVQATVSFHKIIYKAACLTKEDIDNPRIHIKVSGNSGPNGNNMNAPWGLLLSSFGSFDEIVYKQNSDWSTLTTKGIPIWKRFFIGGWETFIYRLYTGLLSNFIGRFFSRVVIVPNENELIIETSYNLLLKGISVKKVSNSNMQNTSLANENLILKKIELAEKVILPIITERLDEWVTPSLIPICISIYRNNIKSQFKDYHKNKERWRAVLKKENINKKVLLTNAPANINLAPLTELCSENKIPVVSAQHGVTKEICSMLGESKQMYEINYSDIHLAYNIESASASDKVIYSRGRSFVVGMSKRHRRMQLNTGIKNILNSKKTPDIVYISTNLYRGNFGLLGTHMNDYSLAIAERDIVLKVLAKIPHKVRYKTYPEDTRRYSDNDPIFNIAKGIKNVELYENKVDMRYLIHEHNIIVTSGATSTLGWPIMSGKPIVFINRNNKMSLTNDSHKAFSEALFLFDDYSDSFFEDLVVFLSQPLSDIYELWHAKEKARKEMIKKYFSGYGANAGKHASEIIIKNAF